MSEVNASIIVQPISATIVVDTKNINFTPTATQVSIYSGGVTTPGGNDGQLQYNAAGIMSGIANVTYSSGNLSLGPTANVKMTGGTNGYVLQTDGSGNLSWTAQTGGGGGNGVPGGSNTQVQFNDAGAFGGVAGFTFDKVSNVLIAPGNINASNVNSNFFGSGAGLTSLVAANIVGEVPLAYLSTYAGTANAVSGANVSGEVSSAALANAVAGANVSGYVANATHANIANAANAVAGANVSGEVANAAYATTAGTAYSVSGANVSGYVANANHANIANAANAVAGANVSGAVGLATYATTANAVAGANVSGYVANANHANNADTVGSTGYAIGYLDVPQIIANTTYNVLLTDVGKHLYHAPGSAAGTYIFPANSNVAFSIGSVVTIINLSANTVNANLTSDTMNLIGNGITGNRIIGAYGAATLIKVAGTTWAIMGTNLA